MGEAKGLEKYFTPLALKLMQENDISIRKLASRLLTETDIDKVFSFNQRGRKTSYPKWAWDMAKKNGISRQLLYERVRVRGMSIEEAVEVRPKGSNPTESAQPKAVAE